MFAYLMKNFPAFCETFRSCKMKLSWPINALKSFRVSIIEVSIDIHHDGLRNVGVSSTLARLIARGDFGTLSFVIAFTGCRN
jgi:hypothetical protein